MIQYDLRKGFKRMVILVRTQGGQEAGYMVRTLHNRKLRSYPPGFDQQILVKPPTMQGAQGLGVDKRSAKKGWLHNIAPDFFILVFTNKIVADPDAIYAYLYLTTGSPVILYHRP